METKILGALEAEVGEGGRNEEAMARGFAAPP
jgi:hypothetical protein